jgi:hypothetical protein
MGVRLYTPTLGRFLQTDPVPGGNANTYTYPGDPVNANDLNGKMGCGTRGYSRGCGSCGWRCTYHSFRHSWHHFWNSKPVRTMWAGARLGVDIYGLMTRWREAYGLYRGYKEWRGWAAVGGRVKKRKYCGNNPGWECGLKFGAGLFGISDVYHSARNFYNLTFAPTPGRLIEPGLRGSRGMI